MKFICPCCTKFFINKIVLREKIDTNLHYILINKDSEQEEKLSFLTEQLPGENWHFMKAKMSLQFCRLVFAALGWLCKHRWTDAEFQTFTGSTILFQVPSCFLEQICQPGLPQHMEVPIIKSSWSFLFICFLLEILESFAFLLYSNANAFETWVFFMKQKRCFLLLPTLNILALLPRHPITSASLMVTFEVWRTLVLHL